MRGRVLAETTGKSPKPAKQNNHHETAYAALDWDIGPDTTAGVGYLYQQRHGGVLKCMLINGGQTKSNGDTVYLSCANSNYRLLPPLPWAEYKAKRQIRQ